MIEDVSPRSLTLLGVAAIIAGLLGVAVVPLTIAVPD